MTQRRYAVATAASILIAMAGPAVAEPKAEIVGFGMTAGRRLPSESSMSQSGLEPAREMQNVRYLEQTDRIEARLCRNFGITLKLTDDIPHALPRSLSIRVLHPRFTRPDGKASTEDRFPSAVVNGVSHVGFTFDHQWEMAPGPWTIVASAGGMEIARKVFTITAPLSGEPNSDCGVG